MCARIPHALDRMRICTFGSWSPQAETGTLNGMGSSDLEGSRITCSLTPCQRTL